MSSKFDTNELIGKSKEEGKEICMKHGYSMIITKENDLYNTYREDKGNKYIKVLVENNYIYEVEK